MSDDWQPFTGHYEKRFYEALFPAANRVVQHCWPNGGMLHPRGWLAPILRRHEVMFRPCTCEECCRRS